MTATLRAAGHGYDVLLDGIHIGFVSKRPGRSFSGGWSGYHSSAGSCGSRHLTRRDAVKAVVDAERRARAEA